MNPTTSLAPSLDGVGRNAVMAAGSCIVKGKLWSCDAPVNTAVPAASGSNRIDRLTLRLLRTAGTATAFLQPNIITGTPSGSPVLPALVQTTTGIWDLPISHWTSTSAGGLTSLVDERFDTGKTMQSGPAANMPTWLVRPTLYYQTDTDALMLWNGSAWTFLVQPPDVTPGSMPAMTNGWSIGGFARYRLNGDNDLQVAFKQLVCGTTTDGTNIWAAGSFPAAYRVPTFHRVPCVADVLRIVGAGPNQESAALEFAADGSVNCQGISGVATRVDCYFTIPLFV
jgi:hypothetical protein